MGQLETDQKQAGPQGKGGRTGNPSSRFSEVGVADVLQGIIITWRSRVKPKWRTGLSISPHCPSALYKPGPRWKSPHRFITVRKGLRQTPFWYATLGLCFSLPTITLSWRNHQPLGHTQLSLSPREVHIVLVRPSVLWSCNLWGSRRWQVYASSKAVQKICLSFQKCGWQAKGVGVGIWHFPHDFR